MNNEESSRLGTTFDRMMRAITGLPDTINTEPSTIVAFTPVLEIPQTFIVQTYRQRDSGAERAAARDTIFLQYVGGDGTYRIVIPPKVADAIARQRDALTTKNRRAGARKAVATRAERGIKPGFLKNPGRGGKKAKAKK